MRVIKLSPNDKHMLTRENVDWFFQSHLKEREPVGQFFITKGRISKNGIQPGETLVFTYLGDIVYIARSASIRLETAGSHANKYPFFFCVDVDSIKATSGKLFELEKMLRNEGLLNRNLVKSQGWPILEETDISKDRIHAIIQQFIVNN